MTKKSAKAGSSVRYHKNKLALAPIRAQKSLLKKPPKPYLIAKIKTAISPKNWTPVITKEYDAPLAAWEENAIKPSIAQINQEILSGFVLPEKTSRIYGTKDDAIAIPDKYPAASLNITFQYPIIFSNL